MNRYLDFLCNLVGRTYEYHYLLERLHGIEFYSTVSNDDNRGEDGKQLRNTFLDRVGQQCSSSLPPGGCTVLEMLIGLAYRIEFDLLDSRWDRPMSEWFWVLIDNLGLEWCDNATWFATNSAEEVDEKVKIMLERSYSSNGDGGLFPLKVSQKNQTVTEIWYQMTEWELENYPI